MQINKYNIRKNNKRVDNDYNVLDKVVITNKSGCKYETSYTGTFVIKQCCNNVVVTLQYGAIKIRHDIRCMKPHTSDTNVEDINPETNDL